MGLIIRVCRKADPESKGKIENFIKYIKHNFFAFREFDSISEARDSLFRWLDRRANGKISQATKKIPLIEIEQERKYLRPIKQSIYRKGHISFREERRVNDKCRIAVDACQYDLPDKYRNKVVDIYRTGDSLFVFDRLNGKEIAEYPLSMVPGQIVKNRALVREMGVRARQLKNEVMGYFTLENWRIFLEANFKTLNRYVRDQCLEARKHFDDQDVDLEMLDEALCYCIENKTFSIANLYDSYRYFIEERRMGMAGGAVLQKLMIRDGEVKIIPELQVSKPDIEPYRDLFDISGGAR
jgi:hypothetical protein